MPIKLYPPRGPRTNWTARGTYLNVYVNRSTGTPKKAIAAKIRKEIEEDIERGRFSRRGDKTFASAVIKYVDAGGDTGYLRRLLAYFGEKPLVEIGQAEIDAAAVALYPNAPPSTRDRSVYTPTNAVLRHAGLKIGLRRPKGSRGTMATTWFWPEQAFALFAEAEKYDPEFAALLIVLCYTGVRLNEALNPDTCWRLADSFAYLPATKNTEPQAVFLPPVVVAALANLPGWEGFRFAKGGHLYSLLRAAAFRAGIDLPDRRAFHILRHTYATWMRRYGGADLQGLLSTRWKDQKSVQRYTHVVVSEEAQRALSLPVPGAESVHSPVALLPTKEKSNG